MLSYDEAIGRVTAPGERFETIEVDIRGVDYTIFRNAPGSLRAIFETTRQRGDAVFLVYEDERWTFAEFASKVDALAAVLVDRYEIVEGRSGRHRDAQLPGVGRRLLPRSRRSAPSPSR